MAMVSESTRRATTVDVEMQMRSTQEAGCQLQRRNSSKRGRKRRRKDGRTTGENQEAIKKVLEDLKAEKKANSTGVEEGPVIACTIDGSVNPPAMCIGSETRLDCRMDSPTAQERARVKSFTLGRGGKQGKTSTNSEFSMDGITAQEMESFTLGRIKQTESIKNMVAFARADSVNEADKPKVARRQRPHTCVSHEVFKALIANQEVETFAKIPDAGKNIEDSSLTAPKDVENSREEEKEEDRKWQSLYQESLGKHGSVSVEVTLTIFIGPPEAGKSTLKHLLVYDTPKAVQTSTAMMDTPEVVTKRPTPEVVTKQNGKDFSAEQYVVGENTSAWQLVDGDVMKKSLHSCISNREYEEKDQYPAEVEVEERIDELHAIPVETRKGACPATAHSKAKQEPSSPISLLDEQYSRLFHEMGGKGKRIELINASFIHLLDTGGQPSFQDVLPLLLDVPSTYVQVFNAAHSLDGRVPISYRSDDHTRVCLEEGAELSRDMMLRSFCSMQTVAQKCSKQLASFLQEGSPEPQLRIFVVGTHKDQLMKEGRLGEATQDITAFLEGLEGKPYYHSIEWDSSAGRPFFLVDAMAGKDDRASVDHLRKCLSSKGSPLKLDVPLMWFVCQEITRCTPKKFFRLQDLEAFCLEHGFIDGVNAASQFRALLQLFSLLGFYSFFNLEGVPDKDNFVCTDTGVFLKEVSKLLAVQFTDITTSGRMKDLKSRGILADTPELFTALKMNPEMDSKWFLEALQHLGIAAHMPCRDRIKKYFIPAVLLQKSGNQKPTPSVAPLCLAYTTEEVARSSQYVPRGVFCRLAVELIRQGWNIIAKESSRTLLKFRWKKFMIFLKDSPGYISVIPQVVVEGVTVSDLHAEFKLLHDIVKDCLSLSIKAVLGSSFSAARVAVGFECHCREVKMPHLAIPSDEPSLDCCKTYKPQRYTNQQRIWFSSVDNREAELKKHSDEGLDFWVLEDCSTAQPAPAPRPVRAAHDRVDEVLRHFRKRFIEEVNAQRIVSDLKHMRIISDAVLTAVNREDGTTKQNEILYDHLERTSTRDSLTTVCDAMISVSGNPKMNQFGQHMKNKLQGLS